MAWLAVHDSSDEKRSMFTPKPSSVRFHAKAKRLKKPIPRAYGAIAALCRICRDETSITLVKTIGSLCIFSRNSWGGISNS